MSYPTEDVALIQRVALAYADVVNGRTYETGPLERAVREYVRWLRAQKTRSETVAKLAVQALESPLVASSGSHGGLVQLQASVKQWALAEYYSAQVGED